MSAVMKDNTNPPRPPSIRMSSPTLSSTSTPSVSSLLSSATSSPSSSVSSTPSSLRASPTLLSTPAPDTTTQIIANQTSPPILAQQLEALLKLSKGKICNYGWKCWESNACGVGVCEGCSYSDHRELILPRDPVSQGQYAIACCFLRRCQSASIEYLVPSDKLLPALDSFVKSGLQSAGDMLVPPLNKVDEFAVGFIKNSVADVVKLRVSKGILTLAGIYLRVIKIEELDQCVGPDVPVYVSVPKNGSQITRDRGGTALKPKYGDCDNGVEHHRRPTSPPIVDFVGRINSAAISRRSTNNVLSYAAAVVVYNPLLDG